MEVKGKRRGNKKYTEEENKGKKREFKGKRGKRELKREKREGKGIINKKELFKVFKF